MEAESQEQQCGHDEGVECIGIEGQSLLFSLLGIVYMLFSSLFKAEWHVLPQ